MSNQTQQILTSEPTYYVMNLSNNRWTKISDVYFNLEDAKKAYAEILRRYPFARLGGCRRLVVKS